MFYFVSVCTSVWHAYLIECLPVRLKEGFDYQRRERWLWKAYHDIVYRGSCVAARSCLSLSNCQRLRERFILVNATELLCLW